jgi:methionine synthase II (cobalamin-independent)
LKTDLSLLAVGIGSLPHLKPTDALELIRTLKEVPHWPQLPNQASSEDMLNQYSFPLVKLGLVVEKEGRFFFDTAQANWLDKVTAFYNQYLEIMEGNSIQFDLFSFPEKSAQGFYAFLEKLTKGDFSEAKFIKGQVTGPVTFGLQLTDQDRRSAYYSPELREIVVKSLALQAFWQTKTLMRYNKPVIIFIDEPGLYGYGQSTFITLKKEDITNELNDIISSIHAANGIVGIHVCASTDWSMIFQTNTDIVNFDAYDYFTSMLVYLEELKAFLERGGLLAWGLIPTSQKVLELSAADLITLFEQHVTFLAQNGLDRRSLIEQSLITPSCGVGSCSIAVAEKVYALTQEVASQLKKSL